MKKLLEKLFFIILLVLLAAALSGAVFVTIRDKVNDEDSDKPQDCNHENILTVEGKAASCTNKGLTSGVKCADCDFVFVRQSETPALGHNEKVVAGTLATCTETGLSDGIECTRCGEALTEQTETPALGHNEKVIAGISPTCTENGLTTGVQCSVCGEVLEEQEVIPDLGHSEYVVCGVPATCTETGLSSGIACADCGEVLTEQTETPALGHNEKVIEGKEATYNDTGLTYGVTCSRCGVVLKEQKEIPMLDRYALTTKSVSIADYALDNDWQNATKYNDIYIDNNVTVSIFGGNNSGKYYDGNQWRVYQNEGPIISFSSSIEYEIFSIKITYNYTNGGVLTDEFGAQQYSSGVWIDYVDGENNFIFSVGNTGEATNGQIKITAIEIKYGLA